MTNTHQSGPDGDHCAGTYVGCSGTQLRYLVYLSTPGTAAALVSQYCRADDPGLITAAAVTPNLRDYADQVGISGPSLQTWPPGGQTLVNLRTFFATQAQQIADQDFSGAGYTVHMHIKAVRYVWSFGDGESLTTSDPGFGPPTGDVNHTYAQANSVTVSVTVIYEADYTVTGRGGQIGPLTVPGGPVRTVPAAAPLDVLESYATLVK